MTSPEWLELAARRSKRESWMLGHAFEEYRQLEGMSEEGLAKELGCSVETLNWLALCRRPEGETLKAQALAISERHGINVFLLVQILRRVKVVQVFQGASMDGSTQRGGMQTAAQDREPEDEPQA